MPKVIFLEFFFGHILVTLTISLWLLVRVYRCQNCILFYIFLFSYLGSPQYKNFLLFAGQKQFPAPFGWHALKLSWLLRTFFLHQLLMVPYMLQLHYLEYAMVFNSPSWYWFPLSLSFMVWSIWYILQFHVTWKSSWSIPLLRAPSRIYIWYWSCKAA